MAGNIKSTIFTLLKGMAMGAANVIPGVSGGTIALVTNIFERLINAVKAFDLTALKLLLKGEFKQFLHKTDFFFLFAVLGGVVLSVLSLAKVLGFLFDHYPVPIWSFFFGLIMASVYFVGRNVSQWRPVVVLLFFLGTTVAVALSFLNPATENDSFFYLFLCGIVAMCSMILPGLSGSFVLILMGNYELVVIDAVNQMDGSILFPVILGAGFGLLAFSWILSWIYKRYKDQTVALLSGFIMGSLYILWPWKHEVYRVNEAGELVLKNGEKIVQGYQHYMPDVFTSDVALAVFLIMAGIAVIWAIERLAETKA